MGTRWEMGWSFGYAGFVPQETRITTEDWYDVPVMGWRQVAVPPEDPAKLQPPRGNRTWKIRISSSLRQRGIARLPDWVCQQCDTLHSGCQSASGMR